MCWSARFSTVFARVLTLAFVCALSAATAAVPDSVDSGVEEQLVQVLERSDVQNLRPGYGICLFDAHGPIWSHCAGSTDLEGLTPFSLDTRFRVGAISELFTTVRVMQLADEGKMDLEAPIARYTPSVFGGALPQSNLGQLGTLKVKTLLSHLTGTPADFFLSFRGYEPLQNIGSFLQGTRSQFPPGAKYTHASGFIDLLGLAIQEQDGRPFESSMQHGVFEPLGMASSSFEYRDDPRNAAMRYRSGQQDEYLAQIDDWNLVTAPSGSMMSSLHDLSSFYAMVLGQGSWNGGTILAPESVSAMLSSQSEAVVRRQGIQVGYVWMLSLPELAHLGRVAWSSGQFIAHRNVVILAEDLGIGVAVATNAWHIFKHETILPLAIETLNTYAAIALGKTVPKEALRRVVRMPITLRRRIAGTYVSSFGVYRATVEKDYLRLSSNGDHWRLRYNGDGRFLPEEPAGIDHVVSTAPDSLTVFLRNGIVASAHKPDKIALAQAWHGTRGLYRIADRSDYEKVHIYAFSIATIGGVPVIQADDAKNYWIRPSSRQHAEIVCHEASALFGKTLEVRSERELLLGGFLFRLVTRGSP